VAKLIAAASAGRVTLRTTARAEATTVLANAGATVAAAGAGVLTITGIGAERTVALLSGHAVPFSEVTAHRAMPEEAYLELTPEAVEFRAAERAASW
jgi:ABC-2 type transport system ATP-binding protein